jgi:hypothetical protein
MLSSRSHGAIEWLEIAVIIPHSHFSYKSAPHWQTTPEQHANASSKFYSAVKLVL